MGLFDSIKNSLDRLANPMGDAELKDILDGRPQSDLLSYFYGQVFAQRTGWQNGVLAVFADGGGIVGFDFRSGLDGTDTSRSHLFIEERWKGGHPTNNFNDPTPLVVGLNGHTFESCNMRIPPNTNRPTTSETMLIFENFSDDYDSDGSRSWVSGASYKLGTVFIGNVSGPSLSLLHSRCNGRELW